MDEIKNKIMITSEDKKQNQTEVDKMISAGVHFGHKVNKKHPKMEPYIFGVRNGISIINITKSEEMLLGALDFVEKLIQKDGSLLVVGTKVQVRDIVKLFAEECGLPYVVERWLGGTFTNFDIIKKRVDHLKDLEKKKESGEFEKYTKKERLDFDREIESLKIKFEGLKSLEKTPDAVLILDMDKDAATVKESLEKGVIVIGISDTNVNPENANHPIPANDDSISSISYLLDRFKKTILEARQKNEKSN